MHAPQLIYIALVALSLGVSLAKNGQIEVKKHTFLGTLFGAIVMTSLIYWGGFFE